MADAALLARLTRAVIVAIAAGSTPYKLIEKVVADLGREHIVGTVLNRVEQIGTRWSDYYSSDESGQQLSTLGSPACSSARSR
jgi:hypothetical protein